MKKGFILFLAYCVLFQSTAFAASSAAPVGEQKEQIVLLPVRGQGMTESELSLYRDAVAQGLSSHYTVKYGEQVDKVIQDIFAEESKSGLECDESRCYRDIATMLNVKLIAKTTIIPRSGDFHVSIVIYNVYENTSVSTKVDVCKKCETDQLLKKLVALSGSDSGKGGIAGASAAEGAASAEVGKKEEGGISWYWYLLGALAVGGAAAALGGGGGGGGSSGSQPVTTPSSNPGTVNVSW